MPSSTIDKALSSTKSFIETFTSSDNPTTTFTEHTVTSVKKSAGFFSKIIGFISQPKFKWYILGLLLCVIAFIYFKFQNKKLNKRNENNTNIQQPLPQQPQLTEQLTDTTSSEEIFIEDKNVMEHNLTAEEMYAIDRQLEDVNIDHLMHASE